jgi:hypothetical protein
MFSTRDQEQIVKSGLTEEQVLKQLAFFRQGFPYLDITAPATLSKGILKLDDHKVEKFTKIYDNFKNDLKVVKFVPASGAATRMFQDLIAFMNNYTGTPEEYLNLISDRRPESVFSFFKHFTDFSFYPELKDFIFEKSGEDLDILLEKNEYIKILKALLTKKGMNYANLPKGLIKFHRYLEFSRTPVEEHLIETAFYGTGKNGVSHIHFTIPVDMVKEFKKHFHEVQEILKEKYNYSYKITHSFQDHSTDTIAVDEENNPFRDGDGNLVFRPGGHGSLLKNIAGIDADLIFIKNIDNIVPDRLKKTQATYKKTLAGILIDIQSEIFHFLELLHSNRLIDAELLKKMVKFCEKDLNILMPEGFADWSKKQRIDFLIRKFNRPIRVCGMVQNEGEPGGGPFFSRSQDGTISLQIVESSQIDPNDSAKSEIISRSTHFNPVDLVCGVRDFNGNLFDLQKFIDPLTGFISVKSKEGKKLKALEWPGLWNGAMADWNTIFVEVPIETFNPVKIVNDLLREEHRTLAFLNSGPVK